MYKYTALFICLVIFSCNTNNSKSDTNQEANAVVSSEGIAVSTQIITTASFNKEIIANGLAEALEKTDIRFNASERIANIYVKNGQKVV